MDTRIYHSAAAFVAMGLLVGACDRASTDRAEAEARRAGDKIGQALDRTGEKLSEAAKKTEEKVSESSQRLAPKVEAAGDRIGEAAQRTGEKISQVTTNITTGAKSSVETSGIPDDTKARLGDAAITASIKAGLLRDRDLSATRIDVDTSGGVVTLNGFAPDEAAKKRAADLAQSTRGVREVRNHLAVKPG